MTRIYEGLVWLLLITACAMMLAQSREGFIGGVWAGDPANVILLAVPLALLALRQ